LKSAKAALVEEALRRAENNQTRAAELLGLSRPALNNWLRRQHGATTNDDDPDHDD